MSFLTDILETLASCPNQVVTELHASGHVPANGPELLDRVAAVRGVIREHGVQPGDRIALVGVNSIAWAAADLAIMAEGAIAVPLYNRQVVREMAAILDDCTPRLTFVDSAELETSLATHAPGAGTICRLDTLVSASPVHQAPRAREPGDCATIIYTSGSSGVAKGVMLTFANVDHMLANTVRQMDDLLDGVHGGQRVFHYLPFCFCGSWICLLSCLARGRRLQLSMNLERLMEEIAEARPHFFMNVPTLLERVRRGVDEKLLGAGGLAGMLYRRALAGWQRKQTGRTGLADRLALRLADRIIFRAIRARISPDLVALVCGSAPLTEETQQFFAMLGIPVLQVYGLTETTAICTMDRPGEVIPGRVGHAVDGIEMKTNGNGEILVRGPHIFGGYWNRTADTAAAFDGDWFRTGDLGEVDDSGNWKIIGRGKDLIILNSGHNIPPEPLEVLVATALPQAVHVVMIGNNRGYLVALITGPVTPGDAQAAIEQVNAHLPHYKRIRSFHLLDQPFSAEDGLLTANGKLRRQQIAEHFDAEIDALYERKDS